MLKAKKVALWTGGLLAGTLLLATISFAIFVHTDFAHQYALRLVTQGIQDTMGGHAEIGSIDFHWARLGADFNRVAIHGDEADSNAALFSADRASIDFGLHLFRRQKLSVDDLTLDRPVLHLAFDSKGASNLPSVTGTAHSPSSGESSTTSLFDLAIGHFVVKDGEIFYNDRRVPIAADIRDLNARVAFAGLTRSYDGTLSYDDSRVSYGTFAPFTHSLQLSATASASGLKLNSSLLQTGASWLKASGQLTNYAAPSFSGSYEASLSSGEILRIVAGNQMLSGQVKTNGAVAYETDENQTANNGLLNGLSIEGKFSSDAVGLRSPAARIDTKNVEGQYGLHRGDLDVSNIAADALGGRIESHLIIRDVTNSAAAQFDAEAKGVSMAAMRAAVAAQNLTQVRVDGRMDGDVRVNWQGGLNDLQLNSNATMAGSISDAASALHVHAHASSFPIRAAVHVVYDGPKQVVTFHDSFVNTPRSHVTVGGVLGNSANLQMDARSDDLSEVDMIVLAFRPVAPPSKNGASNLPQLLGLGGVASFQGTVGGRLANPQITGQFTATNLKVHGSSVQALQGKMQASETGVAIREGTMRNGAQAQATFDVSFGLRDWSTAPDQPVMVHLTANKVSIAEIEHIAGLQYPVDGALAGNVTISGTEESPNAEGSVHLTQGMFWQQPVQTVDLQFKNSGDSILTSLDLRAGAGSATGTIAYGPKSKDYDMNVTVQTLRLNQVQYLQQHAKSVSGSISAAIRGHGNINAPQLELNVDSQHLRMGEQTIDDFVAQASVAQQRATFDIKGGVSGAPLHAQGTVNLTGDYQANAAIDSGAIHLDAILASFLPQGGTDLHGQTQFQGTLKGPLANPDALEGHIEMPSFVVAYRDFQLTASSGVHINYERGVVTMQRAEFKGTETDVTFEASVPTRGSANLKATANGKIDMRVLQLWNPEWQSSGEVTLNVIAQGDRTHPDIGGSISIADGAIAIVDTPTLEKVKGEFDFANGRIQVKTLNGQIGGGNFEVHGFAAYQKGTQYNLGMTAQDVRFVYPDGVRTQLTANLNLVGSTEDANLTGQVSVNRLSLTQSFDLATFSNELGGPTTPPSGMAQNIKLNVAVSSREELKLSSSQLSIQGTADLRVRGTLAEPVILGRTDLTGGELFFNGRRFQIQNASVEFANPVRTEPTLNLTATTTVDQFNLTLNLVGPFDRLRTTYSSDPPVPPVDVINLLITGQTTEAAQGSTTSPQSVIAGQLTSQVSSRLQKLTGISSLSIDPQIGGNQANGASQLAIQERVTKNLFFTFATDVTTTQGVVVQVEYQVTPKYSMSAIRDQTGGYEIEIKARKRF